MRNIAFSKAERRKKGDGEERVCTYFNSFTLLCLHSNFQINPLLIFSELLLSGSVAVALKLPTREESS